MEKLWSCQRTSEQALLECMIEARKELVAVGLMEQAKDFQGQLIYRDGEPAWRITEKGRVSPER